MTARGTRLAALTIAAGALLSGSPAAAHTRADVATDWESRITAFPDLPGVSWHLYPGGEYLRLENLSEVPLTVLGYEGEPYLRVGPSGVERNRNSPATYLNSRRDGEVALPPRADARADPEWEHLNGEPRYVWYDHRVHRMPDDPRGNDAAWEVPVVSGGRSSVLAGQLRLDPGPPWWGWLGVGLALTAGALSGLARRVEREVVRPAALTVGAVAAFNLVHLPDEIGALPVAAVDIAYGIFHHLAFIGAGIAGVLVALRARMPSLVPLALGSGAVAFHQGFLQVQQLGASQVVTVWPPSVIRLAVAMSVAQGLWIALLITLVRRRRRPVVLPAEAPARDLAPGGADAA